jgi:hypothetical protein
LNFGISPSGQAEKIGWEFHVRELNPYFIADGHHVPLIKDHQNGLTWMAERRFAPPTVAAQQRFIKSFAQDGSACIFPDRIGTKENIDRHLNSARISSFGQYHCAARPPVVRGGSRQVAIQDVMVGTRSQRAKRPKPRVTNSETNGPRATLQCTINRKATQTEMGKTEMRDKSRRSIMRKTEKIKKLEIETYRW